MGYWLAIWAAITIEEQVIFRWGTGYDWTVWDQREKLPVGVAALLAFLVGWAGAILCMAQTWYTGPIASLVGEYGADVGALCLSLPLSSFFVSLVMEEAEPADHLDGQLRRLLLGGIGLSAAAVGGIEDAGSVIVRIYRIL